MPLKPQGLLYYGAKEDFSFISFSHTFSLRLPLSFAPTKTHTLATIKPKTVHRQTPYVKFIKRILPDIKISSGIHDTSEAMILVRKKWVEKRQIEKKTKADAAAADAAAAAAELEELDDMGDAAAVVAVETLIAKETILGWVVGHGSEE